MALAIYFCISEGIIKTKTIIVDILLCVFRSIVVKYTPEESLLSLMFWGVFHEVF